MSSVSSQRHFDSSEPSGFAVQQIQAFFCARSPPICLDTSDYRDAIVEYLRNDSASEYRDEIETYGWTSAHSRLLEEVPSNVIAEILTANFELWSARRKQIRNQRP